MKVIEMPGLEVVVSRQDEKRGRKPDGGGCHPLELLWRRMIGVVAGQDREADTSGKAFVRFCNELFECPEAVPTVTLAHMQVAELQPSHHGTSSSANALTEPNVGWPSNEAG